MASPASTFATLRALHIVISDALDDIQRVFAQPDPPASPIYSDSSASPLPITPPTSFPPTPLSATFPPLRSPIHTDPGIPCVDYPSPNLPLISDSLSEQLALHPDAATAASRIVAACGQMSSIVHKPFLSICDAVTGCNLSACMRLVEHLHIAEILREGEQDRQCSQGSTAPLSITKSGSNVGSNAVLNPSTCDGVDPRPLNVTEWIPGSRANKGSISLLEEGMHVDDITNVICSYAGEGYIDPTDLVHVLRLLSTHHILRETYPDTFALTRMGSLLDSGKSVEAIFSNPEAKYDGTDGIAAFVGLCADDLFKTAAYLTEAFTGVELPTLASTLNASFPGMTTIPSTRYAINIPVPCPPTTRSSSVLTHIVFPEDENGQRILPSTGSLERVGSHSRLPDGQQPSQSPVTESQAHLSAPLSPNATSTQGERKRHHSGDAIKPEKLPAFNFAFHTNRPYFEWLENGGRDPLGGTGRAACMQTEKPAVPSHEPNGIPGKSYRLQRFSKAMMATTGWEAPKAILSGFGWYSLPKGSTIVDVGGGIGSTTMILARALNGTTLDSTKRQDGTHIEEPTTARLAGDLPSDLFPTINDEPKTSAAEDDMDFRFVVQDRPVVTALGIEAWRSKFPEMLESGHVIFQDHDFFEPQPLLGPPHQSRHPAVYLLRVVLHDWPDECVRRILINLRVASNPETRLLIAEHVLPLACVDEDVVDHTNNEACEKSKAHEWTISSVLAHIEGAERALAPPPLLPNLGKASANAYSIDLTMQMTLNGKERTLREFCALALSAGWRVSRMSRAEGSLFAYLVCEPIPLPDDAQAIYNAVVLSSELSAVVAVPSDDPIHYSRAEASSCKMPKALPLLPPAVLERSSSRCGTPTFGSRTVLPKDEELQSPRARGAVVAKKWLKSKGLGVRSVMMQKAEKQRDEQNASKGVSARDSNDAQGAASPSHVRVWWKKSPPSSASNSSSAIHGLIGEVPVLQATGRGRRRTLKSSDVPSTPSPRISPAHQKWPSIESVTLPNPEISPSIPHARRPSVASITRKLSFATFRRPSIADVTQPLPTPPPSSTFTHLAPPPTLDGDTGRRLKHLPSLPTLSRSEATVSTAKRQSAIPRRPSLTFAGHVASPPPVLKPAPPRRLDVAGSPKSGILKTRSSSHTSKQTSPNTGQVAECSPPHTSRRSSPHTGRSADSTTQRQRRVTLSNTEHPRAQMRTSIPGSVNDVPDPVEREVKRVPSMPKMPRRLSIPMLRRKQSQSVLQDAESGGSPG